MELSQEKQNEEEICRVFEITNKGKLLVEHLSSKYRDKSISRVYDKYNVSNTSIYTALRQMGCSKIIIEILKKEYGFMLGTHYLMTPFKFIKQLKEYQINNLKK